MFGKLLNFVGLGFWGPATILLSFTSTVLLFAYMWTYIAPSTFIEGIIALTFTFLGGLLVFGVLTITLMSIIFPFAMKRNMKKKMKTFQITIGPNKPSVPKAPEPDDGDVDITFLK